MFTTTLTKTSPFNSGKYSSLASYLEDEHCISLTGEETMEELEEIAEELEQG